MNQAPAAMMAFTNDQLQEMNTKFRCKKDFHDYFTKVLLIVLPKLKNCPVSVSTIAPCSQEHV